MLIVEVMTKGGAAAARRDRATLEEGTLNVGRSQDNDVVLPDPTGAISRRHCTIERVGDGYRLTDTSTNGVFLNAGAEKIGRGNSVALSDGDQVSVGHYQLMVEVADRGAARSAPELPGLPDALAEIPDPAGPDPAGDDLLASPFEDGPFDDGPFEDGAIPADALLAEGLLADEPGSGGEPEPAAQAFENIDRIGCEQVSLDPFQTVPDEQIPEDWDDLLAPQTPEPGVPDLGAEGLGAEGLGAGEAAGDPFPEPGPDLGARVTPLAPGAVPRSAAAGAGKTAGPAPKPAPKPERAAPAATPSGGGSDAAFEAFLAGAGLDPSDLDRCDPVEAMTCLGRIYRDVVGGLRQLLEARRLIKGELRMSQTIIQQSGNNPLKWSLSDDKAMLSLLGQDDQPGCLPAQDAIHEAFDDLKAHQIAMVVGMERAIAALLKRFDPEALEQRIDSANTIGKLMPGAKSRYWEQFTQLYAEIAQEAEEDFDNLFGREFGKAYEEHVRRMTDKAGKADFGGLGRGARRES